MNSLTTAEIFEAIRKEDRKILLAVYRINYPPVRHFILNTGGNEFDAQDVFQDAMVVLFLKIRKAHPELSYGFKTYIFSICKYIWYKELRRKQKLAGELFNPDELIDLENNFLKDYIKMEKRKLVMDHFGEMQEDCQLLLKLFVSETPVFRITKIMGYSSDQYTRNRRVNCKEKLIRRVWNCPRYKELRNEAYQENTGIPRW